MLIGYARISKADGSQSLDLQRDALREAGVSDDAIYEDQASGQREDRPGLAAFLKAARQGDVIVVWRLDRLGRNLRHLVNLVQDLNDRDIGIRVLAGQGASIDTTTASGKLVRRAWIALQRTAPGELQARMGPVKWIPRTEEIPAKVAGDTAYRNARENSDRQNARIEHDEALKRVMTAVLNDDMQLFKQFTDNEGFRRWLTDNVFGLTYAPMQAGKKKTVRD